MGRLDDKVALITGAARGPGRSHAVRLAQEGADIIAVDACARPSRTSSPPPTTSPRPRSWWRTSTGASSPARPTCVTWPRCRRSSTRASRSSAASTSSPPTRASRGGSIILTSSVAGLVAYSNLAHYTSAKHGVTGLMRALAVELAPHNIRVNSIHPTTVNTPMLNNPYGLFFPHLDNPGKDEAEEGFIHLNALREPWVEPVDISNAVLYLASDEARYVTGTTHVVDAGGSQSYRIPHA